MTEVKVQSMNDALQATYREEGSQFMEECRFLGAKV